VSVDDHEIVTVRVTGNLDIYTMSRLRNRMAHFDLADGRVVLDLSRIALIDSSGLGTLLSLANRARRHGLRLPLTCGRDLAGVLEIARLTEAFELTIVDDTDR
jgi:anti-anti-sigma factor